MDYNVFFLLAKAANMDFYYEKTCFCGIQNLR